MIWTLRGSLTIHSILISDGLPLSWQSVSRSLIILSVVVQEDEGEISLSVPVQEAEVLEYPVRSWLASSQHLDLLDRRVLSGGSAVIMLVILSCNTSNMTHSSIPTFPIKSLTKNIYFKSKPFFLINFLIKANDARYKLVADSFHLCNRKFQFLNHKDI